MKAITNSQEAQPLLCNVPITTVFTGYSYIPEKVRFDWNCTLLQHQGELLKTKICVVLPGWDPMNMKII
jgi:hypothetical protein